MSSQENAVAFIGLGVMGYNMAVNLRTKMPKEQTLVVCDVSEAAISRFREQMKDSGPVVTAKTGSEAIQQACSYSYILVCQDTIITVLPNDAACDSVYLDPSTGILAGVKQQRSGSPKIAMECGTMSLEIINRIRDASSQCGLAFVDAPISGGPLGAKAGTLTIMVGCDEPLFPKIKPLLAYMGTSIRRCGAVGSGTAFKTINNYMSITQVLVASEALNIGAKLNLNMSELIDTINSSSGQSWITSKNNPVPGITPGGAASNGYEGGFRIELGQKDLKLGVQLAKMAGAKPLLSIETLKTLEEVASDPRYAGKDLRVVYKWLNEQ
ncbi:hypothetical protein LTS13_000493 [Exophiala xenobiotica]|nr:hypothetical protein LTS13_000493 [Exophiala xenobiotica]KAK5403630.1 hypothetical protein LTR79_000383 [Exophiala xenobiotica]KAK5423119.1 hypothetical protein LTR90_002137 [Exophiala xenobiotica]KAK5495645.1 hypothetical protein LTR26_002261 [Exophiala xenobiotica]KAK5508666.1 hypothetical protein LTR07_010755 [Exophiala xenobiotica]